MGFIKEPEGVDFIINSTPLTDKDREEISQYIRDYKSRSRTLKSKKEHLLPIVKKRTAELPRKYKIQGAEKLNNIEL
ncbi:MAG: hypothetical protein LBT78_04185 [Tannerella sp.]|jgi:sulfite reductase beta subunit-like hemoprotein|nr:hypothetical protein [Tannerella sp.]